MYEDVAASVISSASASGRMKKPTRSPGETVFENDEL
jgi:hypothetical protein